MTGGRSPNILLIVCDQLRADHTGFGGSPFIATPHLDRLAAGGRVFGRAYVANPICMPNRASILTGRAPTAHGLVTNHGALAWTTNTFVRSLRSAGYRTALVGKADIQNGLRRLFEPQAEGAAPVGDPHPPGWDRWEDVDRFLDPDGPEPDDFYGFEHLALTIGHGDMVGGHHLRWALDRGASLDDLAWGPRHALEVSEHWWQVYKPKLPEELHSTTFVTESTLGYIESFGRSGQPWLIQCSYPDPHHPFTPPGRWFGRHDPRDAPMPESFDSDLGGAASHYVRFRKLDHSQNMVQMFGPSEDEYRHAAAAEAGAIEFIDDGVGRLVAALARTGQADDTVVVFTSDHGEAFGDHGLMLKGMMHWDGCTRVPLVVSGSAVDRPGRTPAMASTLDLAPTLLDLAGADGYDGIQGVSLRPVIEDPSVRVREQVYVEEDFPQARAFPFPVPHKARTLVTDDARITRYVGTNETELYDLAEDPLELDNRWGREGAGARRSDMVDRLLDAIVEHGEPPRVGALAREQDR